MNEYSALLADIQMKKLEIKALNVEVNSLAKIISVKQDLLLQKRKSVTSNEFVAFLEDLISGKIQKDMFVYVGSVVSEENVHLSEFKIPSNILNNCHHLIVELECIVSMSPYANKNGQIYNLYETSIKKIKFKINDADYTNWAPYDSEKISDSILLGDKWYVISIDTAIKKMIAKNSNIVILSGDDEEIVMISMLFLTAPHQQ